MSAPVHQIHVSHAIHALEMLLAALYKLLNMTSNARYPKRYSKPMNVESGRVNSGSIPEPSSQGCGHSGSLPEALLKGFVDSGLDEESLIKLRIEYVPKHQDGRIDVPVDAARIGYFDLDGDPIDFYRLRLLDSWVRPGETKVTRYLQAPNSGNHFYLPPLLARGWREIATDAGVPVLITEGEKKAACAAARGLACVGLGGVWNWRSNGSPIADFDLLAWDGRVVYVVFDSPDVKTNPSVTAALESLSVELRRRGALVRVVVLPSNETAKVGLDDYLVDRGVDAFRQLLDSAKEFLDPISEMNEHFATVWIGAKSYVLKETQRIDGTVDVDFARPAEVRPGLAGRFVTVHSDSGESKRVPLFDFWMNSPRRRRYDKVVFEPGGCREGEYNLWRGFAVRPVAGDCGLYLDHVRNIICGGDEVLYQYVICWMAHLVQRPGERPGTALVLRGGQGVGKGSFVQQLGALVGGHFLHLSSSRHLLGNFNAHTKDKLLFFADEAFWAGDKAAEGTLKALVTEPTRLLEHKGKDAVVVNNYAHLIIASNHDWVVPAGTDERRFVVIDVSSERMQDTDYFGPLNAQMNGVGLAALLDYLLKVDISTFNLRRLPKTMALLDTKLLSMSPVQRFWYECLQDGTNGGVSGAWETEVKCSSLHNLYSEHPALRGQSRRATQSELGRFLKRAVPGLRDVRRRTDGGNSRQERYWLFPSLEQCRAALSDSLGQAVPWDDPSTCAPKKKLKY